MFRTKVSWKYRNKVGILVVIEIPRGFFQSLRAPANYFIHVICIIILVFALNVLLEKKSKTERNILRFTILINILIINLRINKYINLHFLQFLVSLESRH